MKDGAAVTIVAKAPGVYKWNDGGSTWDFQTAGPFSHGTTLPGSPSDGDYFILAEHDISADATSGAGGDKDKVSIAGALALNIVSNHTSALVPGGAIVNAGTGNVTLKAQSNEADTAKADSDAKSGKVGIGASVSINLLDDGVTRAAIEDGATFTGGAALSITASMHHTVETEDKAGSEGGISISPSVSIAIVNDKTSAHLGSGSALTVTGDATIQATEELDSSLTSDAAAAGGDVAIGAAVAVSVIQATTTADLARDLNAASLTIGAETASDSEAKSMASSKGESDSGKSADNQSNDQVQNNPNTKDKTDGSMPKAKDSTDQGNSDVEQRERRQQQRRRQYRGGGLGQLGAHLELGLDRRRTSPSSRRARSRSAPRTRRTRTRGRSARRSTWSRRSHRRRCRPERRRRHEHGDDRRRRAGQRRRDHRRGGHAGRQGERLHRLGSRGRGREVRRERRRLGRRAGPDLPHDRLGRRRRAR